MFLATHPPRPVGIRLVASVLDSSVPAPKQSIHSYLSVYIRYTYVQIEVYLSSNTSSDVPTTGEESGVGDQHGGRRSGVGDSDMSTRTNDADQRGVAPVIGIVLLIGITVMLAATVATFAFGLEDETTQGEIPTMAVNFDYSSGSSDELDIEHKSGEVIDRSNLHVSIQGASCSSDPNGQHDAEEFSGPAEFASGKPIQIDESEFSCSGLDLGSATVSLSWRGTAGSSTVIQTWDRSG